MKILHYIEEKRLSWALPWISLLKELERSGVENHVLCAPGGTLSSLLRENSIQCTEVETLLPALPAFARDFKTALDRLSPDLLHTRLSAAARIGGYWGKRKELPVVSTVDKFAKIKYYRNSDRLIACSEAVALHLRKQGVAAEKISVIYNGIQTEAFEANSTLREEKRKTAGLTADEILITAAGRFDEGKGFNILLEAFAKLKQKSSSKKFRLMLMGSGPYEERYKSFIETEKLRQDVIMTGFVADIRPWLQASDIFVFPSDRPEAFGLSLLEAMASGLPSVAAACGGPEELIKSEDSGLLVPPKNSSALCSALERLAASEEYRKKLGASAKTRARFFDIRKSAKESCELYYRLLEERKESSRRL